MKDLPASLQGFQPPLTIQTSVLGDGDATTFDNGNGVVDEELVSPFSWHTGSITSSPWSPEAASGVPPSERLNNEPSHIDGVGLDGLNDNFALFDRASAPDEATSWGHIPDQTFEIANCVNDLKSPLSSAEIAEMPGQEFATAMAWPEMQSGFSPHGASDSLLHRESKIPPDSSASHLSGGFDASISTIHAIPAPTPVSYSVQSRNSPETLPYHDQPGLGHGQAVCWPSFPHGVWDEETGNTLAADIALDLNPSYHPFYSDDSSGQAVLLDQIFQGGLDATDSGAPSTIRSRLSNPAAQMRALSDVAFPDDIAVEHEIRRSLDANRETRVRRDQSSDNSADRQVPPNTISPARARYHGPLPCDDHQPKRRQPFQDPQKRIETREMRKLGACVQCRMQRLQVSVNCAIALRLLWPLIDQACTIQCNSNDDPDEPCTRCQSLSKPTLVNLPCVRYKITDSRLFDKGQHPQFKWSKRWSSWKMVEIEQWRSPETKVITITQDVFGGSTFDLVCREFIPIEGDSLQRTWKKNGITQYYPRAPYAIANMRETSNEIKRFVTNNNASSMKHFIDIKNDKLLRSTYAMAHAMVFRPLQFTQVSQLPPSIALGSNLTQNGEARELLQEVFQLWIAVRMESQSERICGPETLGMEPQVFDQDVNTFGTNSITPIMSAQIELITTTKILQPLKRSILRRLQNLIKANRFGNWLPIYLCLFILLHSCSILTNDEHRAAKKYGLEVCAPQ